MTMTDDAGTRDGGARRARRPKERALLTVAIEGDGVSPQTVGLRELAALLHAAAAALEAAANECGLEPPTASLTSVKLGSARYAFCSESETAERTVVELVDAAKKRGAGRSPALNDALRRLHDAGKQGVITLRPKSGLMPGVRKVTLAAPLDQHHEVEEHGVAFEARVVQLSLKGQEVVARLKCDRFGLKEYRIDPDAVETLTRRFGKHVRVRALVEFVNGEFTAARVERAEPVDYDDLLDVLDELRGELAVTHPEHLDAGAWLRELERDD